MVTRSARPVCVVAGAGPGNGLAIGEKFRRAGYSVVLLSRNGAALRERIAMQDASDGMTLELCDLCDENALATRFALIMDRYGPVQTLVFNAGSGFIDDIDSFDAASFTRELQTNQLALIHCVQQVLPAMRAQRRGNIVITGATGSVRGSAHFLSFCAAKAGQRSIAQSLARQLQSQGIHVAYLVIDGVIETPATRAFFQTEPAEFFLQPGDIADAVFNVTQQRPSGWTFELDLRPFAEKW
jgi:NAD(P)-dependent dehydrogenase (short-subunit alcohol dehydrogenase family)